MDNVSTGWVKFSGPAFLLTTVEVNLLPALFGVWVTALLVPLALYGTLAWGAPIARRLLGTLLAYGIAFLVIGRPTNIYWGFLIAPIIGLCAAAGLFVLVGLVRLTFGRSGPLAAPVMAA